MASNLLTAKIRSFLLTALLIPTVLTLAEAMGRHSDYQDSTVYEPSKYKKGSAANPNPAFAPPKFLDDYHPPSAVAPPPADNPPAKAARGTSLPQTSQPNENEVVVPIPGSANNTPPPQSYKPAPLTPADSSEPPLPQGLNDDNTLPSGQANHPSAPVQ